jgi:hypothetical protein
MKLISSQRYIDDEIVAKKIEAQDFEVQVSPTFEYEGEEYQVILDGHHSFAAAIEAGVEPELIEQTATENDIIGLLNMGDVESFMRAAQMDSSWYYAETGKDVWD